jgi:hypothetical protein
MGSIEIAVKDLQMALNLVEPGTEIAYQIQNDLEELVM